MSSASFWFRGASSWNPRWILVAGLLVACGGRAEQAAGGDSSSDGGSSTGGTESAGGGSGSTGGTEDASGGSDQGSMVITTPTLGFDDEIFDSVGVGTALCGIVDGSRLVCEDETYDFGSPITQIEASGEGIFDPYLCVLLANGEIECVIQETRALDSELPIVEMDASNLNICIITIEGGVECATGLGPEGSYASVATGDFTSCAIRSDGGLVCFQPLSDGFATALSGAPEGEFREISVEKHGSFHGCALSSEGAALCFSLPDLEEVGAPEGEFSEISVGSTSACALTVDGIAICWLLPFDSTTAEPSVLSEEKLHGLVTNSYLGEYCALGEDGAPVCWTW